MVDVVTGALSVIASQNEYLNLWFPADIWQIGIINFSHSHCCLTHNKIYSSK